MTQAIHDLNTIPLAGLMLVVALGFQLGRLDWRGMSLGPAGGTMGIAILLGAAGLSFHQLYSTSSQRQAASGSRFDSQGAGSHLRASPLAANRRARSQGAFRWAHLPPKACDEPSSRFVVSEVRMARSSSMGICERST